MKQFNKITIIGVGLIGGSIGLAIKEKKIAKEVIGLCRRKSSLAQAKKFKAVNQATLNFKEALENSDLVIVAVPVADILKISLRASKFMKSGAILTDVGSVKGKIVTALESKLRKDIHFIGGHPLAGSEKSGVVSAKKNLFEDSICILTETKNTNPVALSKVKKFWQALGAKIAVLKATEHDQIVSEISHLPHLLAMSLCLSADKKTLPFASSGFKGATRIAASTAELWSDIFLYNKTALLKSADKMEAVLKKIKNLINSGKRELLCQELNKAKLIRQSLE